MATDAVTVTFRYTPEEPDPDDSTGMSNDEFDRLMDALMPLGAEDVKVEK